MNKKHLSDLGADDYLLPTDIKYIKPSFDAGNQQHSSQNGATSFTSSTPISGKIARALENPASLQKPGALQDAGLSEGTVQSITEYTIRKSEEEEGPVGAAFGAVAGAGTVVGLAMLFSAPISVPVLAGMSVLGALSGWMKTEKNN